MDDGTLPHGLTRHQVAWLVWRVSEDYPLESMRGDTAVADAFRRGVAVGFTCGVGMERDGAVAKLPADPWEQM